MKIDSWKSKGLWILGMATAFGVGTQWGEFTSPESRASRDDDRRSPRISTRSDSESSAGLSGRSSSSLSDRQGAAGSSLTEIFSASTLSSDGLEALAKEAFKDPNPVKRRLAFARLLEGISLENGLEMRNQLEALGADRQNWQEFHYAWGAIAGKSAFSDAVNSGKHDLEALISGWAAVDPSSAISMLSELPEELQDQKNRLENGIVSGLADRDPEEAVAYINTLVAGGREDAARLMGVVANEVLRGGDTTAAAAWAANLTNGPLKGEAMKEVAERYARSDPQAASDWIAPYAAEDFAANAIREVGRNWAREEPLTAVTWLDNLPAGNGQKSGLNSAFGDWEDKDPLAASEYLLSMPSSAKRDSAVSGFARGYAWQNPENAIAWAQDISDPGLRDQTLTQVGEAYFRRKPDEARAWLPESGLSPAMQEQVLSRDRRRR
ncbi:hypothetical protein N8522_01025 [Akkermansiaceae bacterium]|nr:hypothetical protein [Akkermansiaceae bacterium]MDB4272080.1 hypothetical protein [bacterium]MDB4141833.1 hypothetical protein [Akkermansiaceae bacterium]MDB4274749.1 hypothetical protein [Akkermansiaceae bacterium]MDB4301488.1 hypothetical protein [Akkermansiaceae bacterium]